MLTFLFYFLAGAITFSLLAKIIGNYHAVKTLQNAGYSIVLVAEAIGRRLDSDLDEIRRAQLKNGSCTIPELDAKIAEDQELLKNFQSFVITSFFKFTPKHLQPAIPFLTWKEAVERAHIFLDHGLR